MPFQPYFDSKQPLRLDDEAQLIEQFESLKQLCLAHERDLFFAHALGGRYFSDENDLKQAAEGVEISFPYPDFFVIASKIESWGPMFNGESDAMDRRDMYFILRNVMQDVFPTDIISVCAEYKGQCVTIINLDAASHQGYQCIVDCAQKAVEFLEDNFDISTTMAVSRMGNDPLKLHELYDDTQKIFEYQQVVLEDDNQVLSYEDLSHGNLPPSSTKYLELETKLLTCIQAADYDGFRQAIHELISKEFIDTKPSIQTFRFRVYGTVNSMLFMTDALKDSLGMEFYQKLDPGKRLTEVSTLNEMMLTIDAIIDEMSEHVNSMKKDEPPAWVEDIEAFISQNFSNVNLSVNYIADKFELSPAYCSRIYRQYKGERLFDALQKKRLEAAKQLLSGSATVKEIAEQCGFSSALTMNRAFKRYEGTCPSKLRQ